MYVDIHTKNFHFSRFRFRDESYDWLISLERYLCCFEIKFVTRKQCIDYTRSFAPISPSLLIFKYERIECDLYIYIWVLMKPLGVWFVKFWWWYWIFSLENDFISFCVIVNNYLLTSVKLDSVAAYSFHSSKIEFREREYRYCNAIEIYFKIMRKDLTRYIYLPLF